MGGGDKVGELTTFRDAFQLSFDLRRGVDLSEISENVRKGELVVAGYATTFDLGLEGAVITREALQNAPKDLEERPTILYNHNQDKPIGRVVRSFIDDKGLFVVGAIDETEREIQAKIQSGTLSKFSIRGRILKSHDSWDERRNQTVKIIDGIKLLEVSVVSVPAVSQAEIKDWYLKRGFSLENSPEEKGGESMSKKDEIKKEEEMKRETEETEEAAEEIDLTEEIEEAVEEVPEIEEELELSETDSQLELLFDLEEKISDLMDRAGEIEGLTKKVDKILELVEQILKEVKKYPYPYPYPYPKKSASEGEEAKESAELKELTEAVKEIKEKITALEENTIVRGAASEGEEDDVFKELVESEAYKNASPDEQLRLLWQFLGRKEVK